MFSDVEKKQQLKTVMSEKSLPSLKEGLGVDEKWCKKIARIF